MKKAILPIILGLIAGPLQIGIIYLLIGKRQLNNLFIFIGLMYAFIFLYRIITAILYKRLFKRDSFRERLDYHERTLLICLFSCCITYFIVLRYIANEEIVTSIILSVLMTVIQVPFTIVGGGNSNNKIASNTNEKTEYKDNFGNITGKKDTYKF